MEAEDATPRRSLVECCPLSSNLFAYSSGDKGSGVELYRICRSTQGDDAGSTPVSGARTSMAERRHPYGAVALNQSTFSNARSLVGPSEGADGGGAATNNGYENPFVGVRGTTASSPKSFPRAAAPRVLAGSSGGSDDDDGMARLLNTIPFSSGGGSVIGGRGMGDGRGPGTPPGAARTWPARVKSSVPSVSEPGRFGSAGGSRVWEYKLEGRSTWWGRGDEEESRVTCMQWFPHGTSMGTGGMPQATDIRMLAVGYSSGKIGLARFADMGGGGESVCVVAAASANRACNAVAWDPARPARLAAGWAKSRYDICIRVYDINYVEQWHGGIGATSVEAAARGSQSASAAACEGGGGVTPHGRNSGDSVGIRSGVSGSGGKQSEEDDDDSDLDDGDSVEEDDSPWGGGRVSVAQRKAAGLRGLAHRNASPVGGGNGGAAAAAVRYHPIPRGAANGRVVFGGGGFGGSVWPFAPNAAGWNSPNMAATSTWDYKQQFNEGCACLSWIPGHDSLLAAGMADRYLRILDIRSKESAVKTVEAHRGAVSGVAVRSPDSRVLATWSYTPGEPVKIWDLRKLQGGPTALSMPHTVATLRARSASSVINVAWCPGRVDRIATVHSDNPRRLWLWSLKRHTPRQVPWTWWGYRYTSDPISSIAWQHHGLCPRPLGLDATASPGPPYGPAAAGRGAAWGPSGTSGSSRKGSEKSLRGRSAASVVLKNLAEDEAVTLKFPHRLLTVSSERRFVENIGPMEMSALSVSCHGDAWRGQGFCIFEGSAERSGFCTRVGRDATFGGGEDVGESYVSLARRNIAKSRELPDVSEVMKWRAQAGYRTDPVHNSCEIFAPEFAYKMETPPSADTANHSSLATGPGAPSAGATTISSKILTADIVSGYRLWGWVDRIERLCEEKRRRETFSARGTGLAGLGRRGNRGPSYSPRVLPSPKTREWDRVGLLDAGIVDILAEEFEASPEPPSTSGIDHGDGGKVDGSGAAPSQSIHPTLGCKIFSSRARELAIRACGWGRVPVAPAAELDAIGRGAGLGDGKGLASRDRRLKECPGVPDGLGDVMLACERWHQYERSAALAVFHGDLAAAVKAFGRARDAVKQRHLEGRQPADASAAAIAAAAACAATSGAALGQTKPTAEREAVGGAMPELWTDAVDYDQLLFAMSMCVASFRPPSRSGRGGHGESDDDDKDDEAEREWHEMAQNLINRKELQGCTDAVAAQLRACCVFLKSVPEILDIQDRELASPASSAGGGGDSHRLEIPQSACFTDPLLWLEDRVALACMFLPTAQLKAFLTAEAERCLSRGVLDGALLVGMGPAGVQLLQAYVDRTSDIQTAALLGSRAALSFPGSWKAERMQVAEWVETYRGLLHRWQFWFNKTKFTKWTRKAKAAFDDHPLSPEAAERLEKIRLRHHHSTPSSRSTSSFPPADASAAAAAAATADAASAVSSMNSRTRDGTASPLGNAPPAFNNSDLAPVLVAGTPKEPAPPAERSSTGGGGARTGKGSSRLSSPRPGVGLFAEDASPPGRPLGVNPGAEQGEGVRLVEASGGREPWPDNGGVRAGLTDGGKTYDGFGGGVPPSRHLRLRCNFCGKTVGVRDTAGGGDQTGAGNHRKRSSRNQGGGVGRARAKPFIGYCHSCRKALPRCYVCMQHIDALNPDMEVGRQHQQHQQQPPLGKGGGSAAYSSSNSRGHSRGVRGDGGVSRRNHAPGTSRDKWIARCNTCRHVGHAHHFSYWFETHDTCGVNGCRCKCMSLDSPIVPPSTTK